MDEKKDDAAVKNEGSQAADTAVKDDASKAQAPDVGALVADAVEKAVAKALADREAAQPEKSPKAEKKPEITPESIQKMIADGLSAFTQQNAQNAARDAVVKELAAKGVAPEIIEHHVPKTGDAAALKAGAEKAIARWNEMAPKAPDVGQNKSEQKGASKPEIKYGGGLSVAQAAYADSLK